ncbi:PQQ-binding-like beta-propeller repeat protein [Lentzea tibetensis]|uniref:PQQ-binding-like beta-propeller repeat protein n=1 Tax=Lentzea tibetensis TaxID=2591470 RepID=A0A563F2W0_9PSEU|nr:PQQ-binding-like beta-propeller repeat protein [Lentzea tibetensis]TWP54307.1 PQQ-binding-like beta-propeller repeat protein [Lentzea tibetensis]
MRRLPVLIAAVVLTLSGAPSSAARTKYDWLQFGLDQTKSANNTLETAIGLDNVARLKPLFKTPLNDVPDGAPVLLTGVATSDGMRDLVYLQGERGKVSAFDARTGAHVWSKTFTGSGIANASPALDPNRQFLYANTNDGMVHKLKVADGTEIIGGGWPQQAGPGKASSALTIGTATDGTSYLYASNQGNGHVTTINLATGTQHVFSLACANRPDTHFGTPGGPTCDVRGPNPWARGPSFDPVLQRLFQMGGSNNGNTWVPGKVWRQSWVALAPDGSTQLRDGGGYPVDSYTPTDWEASVKSDRDIGSGGLLILPKNISAKYPHLGVQPGKDRKIRLLNIANLSGKGGPGHLGGELQLFDFPDMSMMRSQGAVWTNPADGKVWVFVPGEKGIAGFQVEVDAQGNPRISLKWTIWNTWTTSAFVANGVLYAANGGGEKTHTFKARELQAINPVTGAVVWTGAIGEHHWSSPIMANGVLYMIDGNSGGFGTGTTGNLIAWSLG